MNPRSTDNEADALTTTPSHRFFYNVVDIALISGVIYKAMCKTNISHSAYIQKVELTGSFNGAADSLPLARPTKSTTTSPDTRKLERKFGSLGQPSPNYCRTCAAKLRKSRTTDICMVCQSPICGKRCSKQWLLCLVIKI